MSRRSVGERLQRARSLAARREIALEWADSWHRQHDDLIREIERMLLAGDTAAADLCLADLKGLHTKSLSALPRVIDSLADEDIA